MKPVIEVYTDGSWSPEKKIGGWAWVTSSGRADKDFVKNTTSQVMELIAVIMAIEALYKPSIKLIVYSDSQYATKGITEWLPKWVQNGWKRFGDRPVLNQVIWKHIAQLIKGKDLKFIWVKGHSGCYWNEEADKLADVAVLEGSTIDRG